MVLTFVRKWPLCGSDTVAKMVISISELLRIFPLEQSLWFSSLLFVFHYVHSVSWSALMYRSRYSR